jgi:hypothetical protein
LEYQAAERKRKVLDNAIKKEYSKRGKEHSLPVSADSNYYAV